MIQKIIPIGNSIGILIPREIANKAGLKAGIKVHIENDPTGSSISINKNATLARSSLTPDFARIMAAINKKYGPALKKLASPDSL